MAGILDNGSLTPEQQIEAIYVGYFGRAGDSGGFAYWENEYSQIAAAGLDTDQVLSTLANAFSASGAAQALYPILSVTGPLDPNSSAEAAEVASFVASVYQNLFNRTVPTSDAGVQYWTHETLNGNITLGSAIIAIANGAQGSDASAVDNKIAVALDFTTQTGAAGEGFGQATPAYIAEAGSE